jgi:cytochrome oxidase Cu insertion factor (SCO1/SenC/PrrC family)
MNDSSDTNIGHQSKQPVNKSNVLTLAMIILVFGLPPLAAYFMYFSGIMPDARMNKGTLIKAEELPEIDLHTMDGRAYDINSKSGKWTLVMLVEPTCDDLCKKNIYLMRQVRTSLGKDRNNIQHVIVLKNTPVAEQLDVFLRDYPNLTVLTGNESAINTLDSFLISVAGDSANKVFIIDPNGSVMMHYDQDLQPKDLLGDLKRLIIVNSNDPS